MRVEGNIKLIYLGDFSEKRINNDSKRLSAGAYNCYKDVNPFISDLLMDIFSFNSIFVFGSFFGHEYMSLELIKKNINVVFSESEITTDTLYYNEKMCGVLVKAGWCNIYITCGTDEVADNLFNLVLPNVELADESLKFTSSQDFQSLEAFDTAYVSQEQPQTTTPSSYNENVFSGIPNEQRNSPVPQQQIQPQQVSSYKDKNTFNNSPNRQRNSAIPPPTYNNELFCEYNPPDNNQQDILVFPSNGTTVGANNINSEFPNMPQQTAFNNIQSEFYGNVQNNNRGDPNNSQVPPLQQQNISSPEEFLKSYNSNVFSNNTEVAQQTGGFPPPEQVLQNVPEYNGGAQQRTVNQMNVNQSDLNHENNNLNSESLNKKSKLRFFSFLNNKKSKITKDNQKDLNKEKQFGFLKIKKSKEKNPKPVAAPKEKKKFKKNKAEKEPKPEKKLKTKNLNFNMKKLLNFRLLLIILLIIAVVGILIGGGFAFKYYFFDSWVSQSIADEAKDLYVKNQTDDTEDKPSTGDAYLDSIGNFAELYKKNSEIVGWITVPNTKIDYPVVKTTDNDFYLDHNFNKEYDRYGAIFADKDCIITPTEQSKNISLYGHHMNDGSMFGDLMKYKELDFLKKNPVFTFDSLKEKGEFVIFSCFITNSKEEHDNNNVFEWRNPNFNSLSDVVYYVQSLQMRSLYDITVDVTYADQIITLSTCTYEFDDARFVIAARKLRNGETYEKLIAEKNSQPLYPQIWYDKYGGTKPY